MEPHQAALNTDREIWREREGDFYADAIHVTQDGGIGINVGGTVIVMPVYEWFHLAQSAPGEIARLRAALSVCAAEFWTNPGTVMSAAAEIQTEFGRRMEVAANALGPAMTVKVVSSDCEAH